MLVLKTWKVSLFHSQLPYLLFPIEKAIILPTAYEYIAALHLQLPVYQNFHFWGTFGPTGWCLLGPQCGALVPSSVPGKSQTSAGRGHLAHHLLGLQQEKSAMGFFQREKKKKNGDAQGSKAPWAAVVMVDAGPGWKGCNFFAVCMVFGATTVGFSHRDPQKETPRVSSNIK